MTGEEQIIIDGVDVSGCTFINFPNCMAYHEPCDKFPNCIYRQLARKTQECDELISEKDFYLQKIEVLEQECEQKDKEINKLNIIIDRLLKAGGYDLNISSPEDFEDVYKDMDYKLGLIDELKQECEELKAYAQRQENQREEYYKEYLKKDKALEEIEGYVRDNSDFDKSDTLTSKTGAYDILDIINKAKERE